MDQATDLKHIKKIDGGYTCLICDEKWLLGKEPEADHDLENRHRKAIKELRLVAKSLKPEERSELLGLEKRIDYGSTDPEKNELQPRKFKKTLQAKAISGMAIEEGVTLLPLTQLPLNVRLRPTGNQKKSRLLEEPASTQAVELPFMSEAKPLPFGGIRPYSEMIQDFEELKFESYKSSLKERLQAMRSKIEQKRSQGQALTKPS